MRLVVQRVEEGKKGPIGAVLGRVSWAGRGRRRRWVCVNDNRRQGRKGWGGASREGWVRAECCTVRDGGWVGTMEGSGMYYEAMRGRRGEERRRKTCRRVGWMTRREVREGKRRMTRRKRRSKR